MPETLKKRVENMFWVSFFCTAHPHSTFTYFSPLVDDLMRTARLFQEAFLPLYKFILNEGQHFPADLNPLGLVMRFGSAWEKYLTYLRQYVDWSQSRDLLRYERIITQCYQWSQLMGYSVDPDSRILLREVKKRYEQTLTSYRKRAMGMHDADQMLERCKANKDHLALSKSWNNMFLGQGCFRAIVMRYKKLIHNGRIDIPSGQNFRFGLEIFDILETKRLVNTAGDELVLTPQCFNGVGIMMIDIVERMNDLTSLWDVEPLGVDTEPLKELICSGGFMNDQYPAVMMRILGRLSLMLGESFGEKFKCFTDCVLDAEKRYDAESVMEMFTGLYESVRYLFWEGKKLCFNRYLEVFPDASLENVVVDVRAYFDRLIRTKGMTIKRAVAFFRNGVEHALGCVEGDTVQKRGEYLRKHLLESDAPKGVYSLYLGGLVRWLRNHHVQPGFHRLPEMFMLDYCDLNQVVDCFIRVLPVLSMNYALVSVYVTDILNYPQLQETVRSLCEEYLQEGSDLQPEWFASRLIEVVETIQGKSEEYKSALISFIRFEASLGGIMVEKIRSKLTGHMITYVMADSPVVRPDWMIPLTGFHVYLDTVFSLLRRLIRFHFQIHEQRYTQIVKEECRLLLERIRSGEHVMQSDGQNTGYKSADGTAVPV